MPRSKRWGTVDKRNGLKGELLPLGAVEDIPEVPAKLSDWGASMWEAFWRSDVAAAVSGAELAIVERWAMCADAHHKLMAEAVSEPTTLGSKDQVVLNPLFRAARELLEQVVQAEKILGIGPLHRVQLGLVGHMAQGAKTQNGQAVGTDLPAEPWAEDPRDTAF